MFTTSNKFSCNIKRLHTIYSNSLPICIELGIHMAMDIVILLHVGVEKNVALFYSRVHIH